MAGLDPMAAAAFADAFVVEIEHAIASCTLGDAGTPQAQALQQIHSLKNTISLTVFQQLLKDCDQSHDAASRDALGDRLAQRFTAAANAAGLLVKHYRRTLPSDNADPHASHPQRRSAWPDPGRQAVAQRQTDAVVRVVAEIPRLRWPRDRADHRDCVVPRLAVRAAARAGHGRTPRLSHRGGSVGAIGGVDAAGAPPDRSAQRMAGCDGRCDEPVVHRRPDLPGLHPADVVERIFAVHHHRCGGALWAARDLSGVAHHLRADAVDGAGRLLAVAAGVLRLCRGADHRAAVAGGAHRACDAGSGTAGAGLARCAKPLHQHHESPIAHAVECGDQPRAIDRHRANAGTTS